MGIGALLATTLKKLPWRLLAVAAIERAPELFQKARECLQRPGDQQLGETAAETELHARLARLEGLLLQQEELIGKQATDSALLKKRCAALESRLFRFKIGSGALCVVVMILLSLVLK